MKGAPGMCECGEDCELCRVDGAPKQSMDPEPWIWMLCGVLAGVALSLMLWLDAEQCANLSTMVDAQASWGPFRGCELRPR